MEGGSTPLNESERRRLRSIELDLARDPELAAAFDEVPQESPVVEVDRVLGAGLALGLVAIVLSLVWELPLLGLVGFAAAVGTTDRLVGRHHLVGRTIAWVRRSREETPDGDT